jgi:spermidine synthase
MHYDPVGVYGSSLRVYGGLLMKIYHSCMLGVGQGGVIRVVSTWCMRMEWATVCPTNATVVKTQKSLFASCNYAPRKMAVILLGF